MRATSIVVAALVALSGVARAQDVAPVSTSAKLQLDVKPPLYKGGETWPLTLVNGADFLEPVFPLVSIEHGDVGRIVLDSALPWALLLSSLDEGIDRAATDEISRPGWDWAAVDQSQDNYPMLWGLTALAGLTSFLPAPAEDAWGYSVWLRLDRLTVFGAAIGLANLEAEVLKPILHRQRPVGSSRSSRPSGHAATAFAAMAFMSDVLRDTFRPQDEPNLGLRLVEEVGSAVPYLGAFYVALERVHEKKHWLTDTLLGGALGAFTTHMLWSWSFLRLEEGNGWAQSFSLAYEPGGFELAFTRRF